MRRFVRSIAAILLTCSLLSPAAAAIAAGTGAVGSEEVYPVILLPGYSGPKLFLDLGLETQEQVWSPEINGERTQNIIEAVLRVVPRLIRESEGNEAEAVRRTGELFQTLFEKIRMNPNGTPAYNVTAYPGNAFDGRWDRLVAKGEERMNNQRPITNSFLDYVPAEKVYLFASDWRLGQVDNAAALDRYIQEVKADSGMDKVSLFGVSYGGQLAEVYFHFYGDKGDVAKAVLHAPAIRGSELAYDLMADPAFAFDPARLVDITAAWFNAETGLTQLLQGLSLEYVSDVAVKVVREYIKPYALYFGSYWDLVPPQYYEAFKAKYLDPSANAEIIRKSDIIHNEVYPAAGETLRSMAAKGVQVCIIAGTNLPLAGGNPISSDYIIDVASTTGAVAAKIGESLSAGYVTAEAVCTDPAHRHISPGGEIDASAAYLPEQTWFFRGQYHAQGAFDTYCAELYNRFLFTDEITDIYSDPDFPQFRDSCNANDILEARFSGSKSGWLTAADAQLELTNLTSHSVSLQGITVQGIQLTADFSKSLAIPPGQSVKLNFTAQLPLVDTAFQLTANFLRDGVAASRTFVFTALSAGTAVPAVLRYEAGETEAESTRWQPLPLNLWKTIALAATCILALSFCAAAGRALFRRRKEN
ncbi:MAG: alpha/beta hydrolase [Oscillospiraceae bacterium]|jgi:pimeloyl-ACP methyl ester carboxylesterase|nr:alpha/beta hydrolase [Oscillospiraceae bacterium]